MSGRGPKGLDGYVLSRLFGMVKIDRRIRKGFMIVTKTIKRFRDEMHYTRLNVLLKTTRGHLASTNSF